MICCILRDAHTQNIFGISALTWPFFEFTYFFYDASSYGSTFKIPSINDGLSPNLKRGIVFLEVGCQKIVK